MFWWSSQELPLVLKQQRVSNVDTRIEVVN
eukprot:SAG11_NODE_26758_length_341_cov_0.772727_1_plen_29_part_01